MPCLLIVAIACAACADGDESDDAVATQSSELSAIAPGWIAQAPSDVANRCVVRPLGDLGAMTSDPTYVLAYRSGGSSCGVRSPTNDAGEMIHRQGIQRFLRGGKNYLLVSMSDDTGDDAFRTGFEIVHMATRGSTGNALLSGGVAPGTSANCADHVVAWTQINSSTYDHAGGLQAWGRYVIVPLEHTDHDATAGFRIVDLATPTRPVWGGMVFRTAGQTTYSGGGALTRLADGRFLAMVTGDDASDLQMFVTTGTTMCMSPSCWLAKRAEDTPSSFEPYQNLQFITGCDGSLYLLATHRGDGEDWADLWRVTFTDLTTFNPSLAKVKNFHAYCKTDNTGDSRYCDFRAGAGAYVTPGGQLYIYGVEHYDDAFPYNGTAVKVREFTPE